VPATLEKPVGRRGGLLALAAAALGGAGFAAGWRATGRAVAAAPGEIAWCSNACGNLIETWSLAAFQAIRAENGYSDPLAASRMLAMMHIALHDAANAAAPRYATYALQAGLPGADPAVAAAAAAHDVLAALLPGQATSLGFLLAQTLSEAGAGQEVARGRRLGAAAAAAILEARAEDGAAQRVEYRTLAHVGAYRFTPGVDRALAPHWGDVTPFALRGPAQFRTPAPPAVESAAYARAFAEVRAFGAKESDVRTEDQTRLAHFWHEFSDIGWNRVARVVARDRGLDLWQSARLFALVNMALADAAIAGWESRMRHDSWRPVTAIRLAGEDFNPATIPDPAWEPLLTTPPMQEHPSTHSALGTAAAQVLAGLLGDATPFALTSATALPENPVRHFPSFSAAARESAESRVMAGLQFRPAIEDGMDLGERIGRHVLATQLRPLE
jgi:hypothetical protein